METASLLLGTNLGDRLLNLEKCREKLLEIGNISAVSSIYETDPWGLTDQPNFWNQAIELRTNLSGSELLEEIKVIESFCGRTQTKRWGPREIDIDILLLGSTQINTPTLQIPHPRLEERRFALTPLSEIAPKTIHPVLGKTILELLKACRDPLQVSIIVP